MSLLNDQLSVWEIGFRWAELDSDQVHFRLPLLVRDNFRTVIDAILSSHLQCETMRSEKYHGGDSEEAQFYIRYWLDPIYACIEGREFNKKMLKWAHVDRYSFQQWCIRRSIPLPEFWFPPGWALDYQWDEESLVTSPSNEAEGSLDKKNDLSDSQDTDINNAETLKPEHSTKEEKVEKLRANQQRTIAVQVVAINLWKENPEMTITQMINNPVIQDLCGAKFQVEEVVRKWLRAVAPPEVKQRRGRPPSKKDIGDK